MTAARPAVTRQLLALAWRESRTARQRLLLYMSSISLGVGALVAIDSFSENVTQSVHDQSRALLGGDVAITKREPHDSTAVALLDSLRRNGFGVTRSTNLASMALVPRSGGTRRRSGRPSRSDYPGSTGRAQPVLTTSGPRGTLARVSSTIAARRHSRRYADDRLREVRDERNAQERAG